jgi:hypothetical protein
MVETIGEGVAFQETLSLTLSLGIKGEGIRSCL